ncbi:MAG: RnfABCDGE type electron transport complex subunit C [Spirochaetes bacterium]|nr:RnfABCDGE type electron transport complex subunit C [Spirochaetota bacterium]
MNTIASFRSGGIELVQAGEPDLAPTKNAFLPAIAIVALKQHAGQAARCIVADGDTVKEGQVVGRPQGPGSSSVHSPVPGIVRGRATVSLPGGERSEALVISMEGSFERLGRRIERFPWRTLSKGDLLRLLEDKGAISNLPEGIPLSEKIDAAVKTGRLDALVLNAIETEPWLCSERRILADRIADLAEGLDILSKLLSPARIIVAGAQEDLRKAAATTGSLPREYSPVIEFVPCAKRYPQELPNQVIEALFRKREQAPRVFMISPSTTLEAFESVVFNRPVIERYITVAGESVMNPSILKARVGTPIGDLFEECGGFRGAPGTIIMNGPLRGSSVIDLDVPVMKTTSAILALAGRPERRSRYRCMRCGRCIEACPESLDPASLWKAAERIPGNEAQTHLADCTLCGVCAYICPSRLPLTEVFAAARRARKTGASR